MGSRKRRRSESPVFSFFVCFTSFFLISVSCPKFWLRRYFQASLYPLLLNALFLQKIIFKEEGGTGWKQTSLYNEPEDVIDNRGAPVVTEAAPVQVPSRNTDLYFDFLLKSAQFASSQFFV